MKCFYSLSPLLDYTNLMFTRNEKIVLFSLAAIQFNHIVDFMIVMPLGPKLMRVFEISPEQFSLLVSMYTLMAGLSGFLASFYVDKFDRKSNLIFMFVGFIISTALCGLAPNFGWLMGARAFAGFFGGIMNSLILSIVSDLISYERRATAMGTITSAFSLASILGVPFSLYLSDHFDWHAPFMFLALSSIIVLLVAVKHIPSVRSHLDHVDSAKKVITNPFTNILQSRTQLFSLFFMFILMLGHFSIIPFISPSLVANAGVDEKQLLFIYLVGGSCSMLMAPLVGKLSDKYGKAKIFTWALFFSVIPVILITHQTVAPLYLVLLIAGLFFISAVARMIPAQALISSAAEPAHRGSFLSILSCVQSLSMAIGSWMAGQIIIKNAVTGHLERYQLVGYIAVGFGFLSLIIFQKIKYLDVIQRKSA
jgi:DHA1 family inner membrane transport protein